VLPFRFAQRQLYVERSCLDEDCRMAQKKEETPTPASDVLRDAMDAPLEGLGWIYGFIPSSPLLFKRTVRRPELRKILPLANTTIYEVEQRGEFPRRFFLTSRCVVWIWQRSRPGLRNIGGASDAASIQRAPAPDVRERKTRPVRHQ
jgi:prophage regulatory protein